MSSLGISLTELSKLYIQAQVMLKSDLSNQHSESFIQEIGQKILLNIPIVEANTVGLGKPAKYPSGVVRPHMMNGSAARGVDGHNRPFILLKVDLLDSTSSQQIAQVVEVVFKRYSLDGDGKNGGLHGENYVTALSNRANDGTSYQSGLYSSGGMTDEQWARVRMLLEGKTIEHEFSSKFLMRIAK